MQFYSLFVKMHYLHHNHSSFKSCFQPISNGSFVGGFFVLILLNCFVGLYSILLLCRSAHMGQELRQHLTKVQQQFPNVIKEIRGKGLFNAVELNSKTLSSVSAFDICIKLKERGVLAKPTHNTIIRLTPPLCMR